MTDLARATASGADDSVFVGLERAGAGAMASVFRGTYLRSGRTVAVKRVLPALTHNEHITQMFADECRVHSTLDHPKVVRYVTHGRDADGAFLALEWVDGTSARSFVDPERKLTTGAAVAMALDVLDALDALHRGRAAKVGRSAILHRDISPANVLVGADGFARLADFGLARVFSFARTTPPGTTAGKLGYLPPEVLAGRMHTTRGDLYALGVVLWEVLAGERLMAHVSDAAERAKAFVIEPRRPLVSVRPTVSPAIAAVIDRALSLDPAQRFASAEAMASAVREAVSRDEWSKARDQLAMAARGGHVRRSRRRSTRSVN
ncbi:MAG: serine/threonine-protein kinase [Polyangiales bacterium]